MADKKNKNKNKAVERRTTPGRGRYGGFRLSRPPHAPRSPSTYTAMDLYSRTYHTAAHGLVKNFVPVSFMDIQQHKIRWYPRYCAGIFHFFYDCPPSRGPSDPSPRGRLYPPPARRVGHRRQFFRRGFFGYVTITIFSKIHLDVTTTTTTEQHYVIRMYIFCLPYG